MTYVIWAYSQTKINGIFPIDRTHQAAFYSSRWAKVANRFGKTFTFKAKVDAELASQSLAFPGLSFKADRDVQ